METSDIIIVGLDIGTTKIATIVGRRSDHGKIEILGSGKTESIGVKRGVVSNIENTVQSIKKAIEEAESKSNVKIDYVNVGIAGQHIKSLQHRGIIIRKNIDDEISQKDVDDLLESMRNLNMSPGEEIIDVIPQEYIIDGEAGIREPVGMLGNSLEANFHIIVGQTTAAKNIFKCVRKSDLDIVDLILEPIASAKAVLSDEEKEAGVALVDIGGGTTDVAIFHDGIIRHTAVIPFGGDVITEDVKEGCSIIKKHAEELKVKFGSALASENKEEEVVAIPGLRGRPPKENVGQVVPTYSGKRSTEIIGDQTGESYKQVQRFIRLTELVPELLDMVDAKNIAFNPAVELSYLKPHEQVQLMEAMDMEQSTPSLSQAQRLKKYSQDGKLTFDVMTAIMSEDKKGELDKVTLTGEKLKKYFPKSYTPQQMEETILKLLEGWSRKRQQSQER